MNCRAESAKGTAIGKKAVPFCAIFVLACLEENEQSEKEFDSHFRLYFDSNFKRFLDDDYFLIFKQPDEELNKFHLQLNSFFISLLWPFQEYFTYIEPIVHQR